LPRDTWGDPADGLARALAERLRANPDVALEAYRRIDARMLRNLASDG